MISQNNHSCDGEPGGRVYLPGFMVHHVPSLPPFHQVAVVPAGHGGAAAPALIPPGHQSSATDGQDQQIATGEGGANDAGRLCLLL